MAQDILCHPIAYSCGAGLGLHYNATTFSDKPSIGPHGLTGALGKPEGEILALEQPRLMMSQLGENGFWMPLSPMQKSSLATELERE